MQGRVLIVDDDRSMCEMLEADLRLRGFECTWTTSPQAALQILKSAAFHVVLTDLRMPGMSGTELCERIVANRPDVPVVVMTAFGSLESAVAAMRVGAYDFVTKPIELDILALALAARRAPPLAAGKSQGAQPGSRGLEAFRRDPGHQRSDAGAVRSVVADCGFRSVRADHRRKRHGQGTRRPRDPPPESPAGQAVCGGQLRRAPRCPAGKRTLRARQGRLHRRARRAQRSVSRSRIRDPVSGRNRRFLRCPRRPNCCGPWRNRNCAPSVAIASSRSTCGS